MVTQKFIIVVLRGKSIESKIYLFLGLSLFLQRVLALFLPELIFAGKMPSYRVKVGCQIFWNIYP